MTTTVRRRGYQLGMPSLPLPHAMLGLGSVEIVASRSQSVPIVAICRSLLPSPPTFYDDYFSETDVQEAMPFPTGLVPAHYLSFVFGLACSVFRVPCSRGLLLLFCTEWAFCPLTTFLKPLPSSSPHLPATCLSPAPPCSLCATTHSLSLFGSVVAADILSEVEERLIKGKDDHLENFGAQGVLWYWALSVKEVR